VVQRGVAKNHNARRLPVDDELWDILRRLEAARQSRQPSIVRGPVGDILRARFSRNHVFVNGQNAPLSGHLAYTVLLDHCRKAGIPTRTVGSDGRVEHIDVHSLRVTFATALITAGADPKTVQELLGHKKFEMTMNLYTKIHTGTKLGAVWRLPWSRGAQPSTQVVEFGGQFGHKSPTGAKIVAATG